MSTLKDELKILSLSQLQTLAGKEYFNITDLGGKNRVELVTALIKEMESRKMWFIPKDPSQMTFSYNSMTDDQLKKMLKDRGVKYIPPARGGKENIIKLLSAESCNVENDDFCSDPNKYCDIVNNICIDQGDTNSDTATDLYGHKVIGTAKAFSEFSKKYFQKPRIDDSPPEEHLSTPTDFNESDFSELKPTPIKIISEKSYINEVRLCLGLL